MTFLRSVFGFLKESCDGFLSIILSSKNTPGFLRSLLLRLKKKKKISLDPAIFLDLSLYKRRANQIVTVASHTKDNKYFTNVISHLKKNPSLAIFQVPSLSHRLEGRHFNSTTVISYVVYDKT